MRHQHVIAREVGDTGFGSSLPPASVMANVQTLRLRRPNDGAPKPAEPPKRHTGILQDQLRRAARPPWCPSFSMAIRILLLVRITAAIGYGFQTWETSPVYAIRSWAYIILYYIPAKLLSWVLHVPGKRPGFFSVRITLAVASSICEARLYETVKQKINNRVARYMFFMLVTSAGMWNASIGINAFFFSPDSVIDFMIALLPSSFAMYATTLACSFAFVPASNLNGRRTFAATLLFATGAIVGWPFALAIAIPFVIEELFVFAGDRVSASAKGNWLINRWTRLLLCGGAAMQIAIPVILIDTFFYGKVVAVPWNIIKYNVFPDMARGPNLYGTEPWYFYILNLLLNFNALLPLALLAIPALFVTYRIDRRRLGSAQGSTEESSPFTILGLRLLPLYLWLGILTAQAHKEERFMFPAYPLICFNAAVTLYLIRGWMEVAFIKSTNSPYKASKTPIFRLTTLSVITIASIISISRILALWKYYHTPMTIMFNFENEELPRLLNVTGFLPHPLPPPGTVVVHKQGEEEDPIDLTPIKEFGLRLCIGKEWYRFPGHYLVPDGVRVDWIKSNFDGQLPAHFMETHGGLRSRIAGTSIIPKGLNDYNMEEPMHYVDVSICDYLMDLDFPHDPVSSVYEPRWAVQTDTWDRVSCLPFLDARHSSVLTRTLWLPGETWQTTNTYGDYCLLRNNRNVEQKIESTHIGLTARRPGLQKSNISGFSRNHHMSPALTISYNLHPPEGTQSSGLNPTAMHRFKLSGPEGGGYKNHYEALRAAILDARTQTGDELTAWRDAVGKREETKEANSAAGKGSDEADEEDEEVAE
ncbi:hypothetical protein EW146_g6729 [Bondarzewia mesenterica]|uniref:Mannosyltransferase n=1 Tax=Bondarzewia mesenterica TaxID=1095465 RepID=A0A4S4LMX3_9AGAM|nr:hypothetical protein EW146_g6729 [Bondarzewia mesenterica]